MAIEYVIEYEGQPLLWNNQKRNARVVFCEPQTGVNKQTAFLVLSGGYKSKIDSNAWIKMRNVFADKYNVITIQCDYFGYCYVNHDFLTMKTLPPESEDCYNEMGPIQAMDHLRAIQTVIEFEGKKGNQPDTKHVLFFGHSHGAYLAYLCNAFAPKLFSAIIDNSAYLFPYHMDYGCPVTYYDENEQLQEQYHYYIEGKEVDRCIYDLNWLYKRFHNETQILVFHGTEDKMIPLESKREFLRSVGNTILHEISPDGTGDLVFRSAEHSLDANFFFFFNFVVRKYGFAASKGGFSEKTFRTPSYKYKILLEDGWPRMIRE